MAKDVRKSKLEILRGRLRRAGFSDPIRDDMPEDVAAAFLFEMNLCPDCAAAAASNWRPDQRTEVDWKDPAEGPSGPVN